MFTDEPALPLTSQVYNSAVLPPKWVDCPRRSLIIVDRFVACKTPLDDRYNNKIGLAQRWTCKMLINSVQQLHKKLGLVISLTDVGQFYNYKVEFEDKGILYQNIPCRAEDKIPDDEQMQRFIDACNNFIGRNPDDAIVVHCNDGFNLTGFLMCSFLCREIDMSIDCAISHFAQTRQPGIYKQNYLDTLVLKMGDESSSRIVAPVLPAWCLIDSDDEGESNEQSMTGGNYKRSRSNNASEQSTKRFCEATQVKSTPQFAVILPGVEPVHPDSFLLNIQRKCQQLCGWNRRGFPGYHPVPMNNDNYKTILQKSYMVTWKSIGTRYIMLIEDEGKVYMFDKGNNGFAISHIRFPHDPDCTSHLKDTLLDGVLVIDSIDGKEIPRFLINDIIAYNGDHVRTKPLRERLAFITKSIIDVRQQAIIKGRMTGTGEPFSIRRKDFFSLSVVDKLLSPEFHAKVPHKIEGLIFLPEQDPYTSGPCSRILEWKETYTIDFLLKISVKNSRIGNSPEKKAALFVNGMDSPFSGMHYSSDLCKYDNKIISCFYENGEWHFDRLRADRSLPNSKKTALSIIDTLLMPITKQILSALIKNESGDHIHHINSASTT